jgi:uncharacterized protein (TIGR03067 family)
LALSDWERLQGTWRAVLVEEDGRARPAGEVQAERVIVYGDRYSLRLRGHTFRGVVTRIEPGQAPRAIDFLCTEGPGAAGKRFLGIYLLEGDELTVCLAPPGRPRPTEFAGSRESGHALHLLRREDA